MTPISRNEANERGLARYFTGKACKRGHFGERFVSSKQCILCDNLLKKARYAKAPDIHRSRNKDCRERYGDKINSRRRDKYRASPDQRKLASRLWRKSNSDTVRAMEARRHKATPNRSRVTSMRWKHKNKEKLKLLNRIWRKSNHIRCLTYTRNYKAKKLGNGGHHSDSDIKYLLTLQRSRCAYCRRKLKNDYHVDHIMPVSREGSNNRANLQILCPRCNLSKGAKDPITFAQSVGLLL